MPDYYSLPTVGRQRCIILVALVAYVALVSSGYFLIPSLPSDTKKIFTQVGLVVLFIASLNAGLPFVWASKARHNEGAAKTSKESATTILALLQTQAQQLGHPYVAQIAAANQEIAEANRQLGLATSIP